jgi:hypothetical protein
MSRIEESTADEFYIEDDCRTRTAALADSGQRSQLFWRRNQARLLPRWRLMWSTAVRTALVPDTAAAIRIDFAQRTVSQECALEGHLGYDQYL